MERIQQDTEHEKTKTLDIRGEQCKEEIAGRHG